MISHSSGRNPLLPPDIFIPDGEPHVFGNRLYVYGSRDMTPGEYCSEEYCVVSTEDCLHWSVSDKSFDGKDVPWADKKDRTVYPPVDFDMRNPTPFLRGFMKELGIPYHLVPKFLIPKSLDLGKFTRNQHLLYAPDCMERDGKYYLYFCMANQTEGVAVSDSPEGPFRNPRQLPCAGIDPAVFADDDGKCYYYWGQFRSAGVQLNEDLISFDPKKAVYHLLTEEEHGFHEGSSMRKRNGIYYYIYPCIFREGRPTCLAYATSDSPLGPFTYRGILIDNRKCDPDSWNNHGSIECFHGQWYVFYHRSSSNSRTNRRMCAEKIYFREDGTIEEVVMTSSGIGEPFAAGETIPAWRACEVEGGAYIDGETLKMPAGSCAVFRWLRSEGIPTAFRAECEGSLDYTTQGCREPGLYQVRITSRGESEVKSITMM